MPPGGYPLPIKGQLRQLVGATRAMVVHPPALVERAPLSPRARTRPIPSNRCGTCSCSSSTPSFSAAGSVAGCSRRCWPPPTGTAWSATSRRSRGQPSLLPPLRLRGRSGVASRRVRATALDHAAARYLATSDDQFATAQAAGGAGGVDALSHGSFSLEARNSITAMTDSTMPAISVR